MTKTKLTSPFILSLLTFTLLAWGSITYISFKKSNKKKDIRSQTLEVLVGKKSNLEKSLYSRIFYTRGIAAIVSINPNITDSEYYTIANEFIRNDSIISSMALSKNCIINAITPLEGHEEAIGLNLLDHPKRRDIVERSIKSKQTFIAGPVELVEGGTAFISYTPIFDSNIELPNNFWGVTDIVIYQNQLLNEAGITENENEFKYALRGDDGKGAKGNIFWGDASTFSEDPVIVSIDLPTGNWELAATPTIGWQAYYKDQHLLETVLLISSLIISLLLFMLLRAILKIRRDKHELKAIFKSLDSLIFEFDNEGVYKKIVLTNNKLQIIDSHKLLNSKLSDIFDTEISTLFMSSIAKCLETKEVIIIDYSLEINAQLFWFTARISYKSENRVIFSAYDNTNIKLAEEELKKSAAELKALNELKDRLFSILAHDLKNPIGSFKSITNLLLEENNTTSEPQKRKLLTSIRDTSDGLNNLIDNLLIWANSQQNLLHITQRKQSIYATCQTVIASQQTHALIKEIEIKNLISPDIEAYFDSELTKVILRNIISNAIKYSFPTSIISVNSKIKNKQVEISVVDTGCGLSENHLKQLFTWNDELIRAGTNNEKGNGLGLVLCKEFTQLQGGSISAKNNKPNGSTFTFTLPLDSNNS